MKKSFAIVCNTTKGFPIDYMMNVPMWHYRSPNKAEHSLALKNLKNYYKEYEK